MTRRRWSPAAGGGGRGLRGRARLRPLRARPHRGGHPGRSRGGSRRRKLARPRHRSLAELHGPRRLHRGAPKSSALRLIRELETAPRGPYCGGIGWADADRGTAELAVGIRTFWIDRAASGGPVLRFGTGAGITWGSDPAREWDETELKAAHLLEVASGRQEASAAGAAGSTRGAAPTGTSGR